MMRRGICGSLLLCLVWLSSAPVQAFTDSESEASVTATAAATTRRPAIVALAPQGFDDLIVQAGEPQYFDVWYAGSRLGATFITLENQNLLLIDQPEAVVQWLLQQDLKAEFSDSVEQFLYQPVSYISGCHVAMLSTPRCKLDAAQLSEPIYVTIDRAALRLDIHIGALWRDVSLAGIQKYLGDSTAGLASLNQFNGVVSGRSNEDDNYNIGLNSYISKGNARFSALLEYGSDAGTRLGNAYWQRDQKGRALRAGYVNSGLQSSFFTDQSMLLVDYSTEYQTRSGYDDSRANPIFVFLSERATIEVYRDGKLIDVSSYQPGNQQLNTERLPSGTYDIELAISEGGALRLETHRLVKDARLPDADETFIQFTLGEVVDNQSGDVDLTGQLIGRAMMRRRLTSSMAGSVGAIYDGSAAYVEASGDIIGRYHRVNLSSFVGDDRSGGYVRGEIRAGQISLYADYRSVVGDQDPSLYRSLLGQPQTYQTLSLNFPLWSGSLSYRDTRRTLQGALSERSKGLSYRRTLYSSNGHFLFGSVEYTDSLSSDRVAGGLSYQWRPSGSRYYSIRSNYEQLNSQSGVLSHVGSATWLDQNGKYGDMRNELRLQESQGNGDIGVNGDVKSHWGNLYYAVDRQFGDVPATNYSARLNWSTVITPEGIEIGGKDVQRASIVIRVDGGRNDLFDLRVNGRVVDQIKGSSARILNLMPYREYQISITPVDSVFKLNRRNQFVTLYPGNVQLLTWQATKVIALVGQLYADGKPAASARIMTKELFGKTDIDGWFQFDISDQLTELEFDVEGVRCVADVPKIELVEGVAFIERLNCVTRRSPSL